MTEIDEAVERGGCLAVVMFVASIVLFGLFIIALGWLFGIGLRLSGL